MTEVPGVGRRPGPAQDALAVYQAAAWRAPGPTRFDSRPANDFLARAEAVAPTLRPPERAEVQRLPRWVGFALGALLAALLGAIVGGMLAL